MEAISASRPQEMKSSTSQRAGSSRTFLKTMYFTSGENVITRRLRTRTSPVVLYSDQSARTSSGEMRFLDGALLVATVMTGFAPCWPQLADGGRTLRGRTLRDGQVLFRQAPPGALAP